MVNNYRVNLTTIDQKPLVQNAYIVIAGHQSTDEFNYSKSLINISQYLVVETGLQLVNYNQSLYLHMAFCRLLQLINDKQERNLKINILKVRSL